LQLRGNVITIKKTSDPDSKIHFIGFLSRKTTSIRPINSAELGRDCLLLEGVQIPLSSERRPSTMLLEEEDEDIVLSTGTTGGEEGDGRGHTATSGTVGRDGEGVRERKTVTMEIGFESGEEIDRWLEVTQDLIN
jgi:hypothetical protein